MASSDVNNQHSTLTKWEWEMSMFGFRINECFISMTFLRGFFLKKKGVWPVWGITSNWCTCVHGFFTTTGVPRRKYVCSHFKRHEDAQECDKGCHQISIEKKHVKSSYERLPFCYPFVVLSAPQSGSLKKFIISLSNEALQWY